MAAGYRLLRPLAGGQRLRGQSLLRYEEEVPVPLWFQLVLFGCLVAVGFAVVLPAFGKGQSATSYAVYYLVMVVALALTVFVFVSFRRLSIAVSDEEVRFGFGVLRKSIPVEAIRACEAKRYNWLAYGGWGLRFALGGRRAYSMPGVAGGVEITVAEGKRVRRYFVSSRYPERLAEAVRGR